MYFWIYRSKKENSKFGISSGLGYDKSNGIVRTTRVDYIFSCIPELGEIEENEKRKTG